MRKNEHGYTFLELILSLFLFTLITMFIATTTPMLRYHSYTSEIREQMEWDNFIQQAKREIRNSDRLYLSSGRLFLYAGQKVIKYEKYGNLLRRQVDGEGHEVLLYNTYAVQFKALQKAIKISIERDNAKTYSAIIYLPKYKTKEFSE
ncbi:competence type IV pilus minor pilin ComGF [Caldibacillus lycopersici]|uniref:Competence type IV pilus minor pilin ComGF n=1 Tax=Perspicuibacillus lycopersici TaxID=1325689 RepID=A0AAE3LNH4_9BACI|nr:competence type IV pilus minor pilin ComGF [Perspicuibacillus lycopersici]MCU9613857.1 competence type IV pilus minor pilin ComGF [Perspicuibacillus lycopersici]